MRKLSFLPAFAIILAGPSVAGVPDDGLPGIGTFAYSGPPAMPDVVRVSAR